jgi:hypothetical protein
LLERKESYKLIVNGIMEEVEILKVSSAVQYPNFVSKVLDLLCSLINCRNLKDKFMDELFKDYLLRL